MNLNDVDRSSNHAGAPTLAAMRRRWRLFWRIERRRQMIRRALRR